MIEPGELDSEIPYKRTCCNFSLNLTLYEDSHALFHFSLSANAGGNAGEDV